MDIALKQMGDVLNTKSDSVITFPLKVDGELNTYLIALAARSNMSKQKVICYLLRKQMVEDKRENPEAFAAATAAPTTPQHDPDPFA